MLDRSPVPVDYRCVWIPHGAICDYRVVRRLPGPAELEIDKDGPPRRTDYRHDLVELRVGERAVVAHGDDHVVAQGTVLSSLAEQRYCHVDLPPDGRIE